MRKDLALVISLSALVLACTANVDVIRTAATNTDGGVGSSSNGSSSSGGVSSSSMTTVSSSGSTSSGGSSGASSSSSSGGLVQAAPAACNFGSVPVGQSANCTVTLANAGSDAVMIDDASFEPGSHGAFSAAPLQPPLVIAAGGSMTLVFQFAPSESGTASAGFGLSFDNGQPRVVITLSGNGTGSTASNVVANPQGCDFGVVAVGQTANCTVTLSNTGSAAVTATNSEFSAGSDPAFSVGPLLPPMVILAGGTLTLAFSFSPTTEGPASGQFAMTFDNAQPTLLFAMTGQGAVANQLTVQLTWDDAVADLDIHLVNQAGTQAAPFTDSDCHYANCRFGNVSINWGSTSPVIDVDDTGGFGPENISWSNPVPGEYLVGAHWFSGGAASLGATVRVYFGGAQVGEATQTLNACNQYWEAGRIAVAAGSATFVPGTALSTATQGTCN